MFMSMFSMVSDTLLQCFLVDEELDRGDGNRPAIMNDFIGSFDSKPKNQDEDFKKAEWYFKT